MNTERLMTWPVTLGSLWVSKTIPGSVWELTMAESGTQIVRLDHGKFSWEGTICLAQDEFKAAQPTTQKGH